MTPEQLELLIKGISLPGAAVVIAFLLKPILPALADLLRSWMRTSSQTDKTRYDLDWDMTKRMVSLEKFQAEAEGNHFTDLSRLMDKVEKMDDRLASLDSRVSRIEGRLNGSLK